MWQIVNGDNRTVLAAFPDNHFDAIVTDPPYGIDFLGKAWDANVGALETYQQCLRVLKPGGHILAFSAARTYHHLAVTLEQAGFEIRDQIMWIYSSGFPKSQDIGKNNNMPDWTGWGTALKPAHEPIALARKPLHKDNSIARNCQQWGVGALNIDETRVPFADESDRPSGGEDGWSRVGFSEQPVAKYKDQKKKKSDVEIYLNNKRGPMERAKIPAGENIGMFEGGVGYKAIKREVDPKIDLPAGRFPSNVIGEIEEPYQKYFYCPKVSRAERHMGCVDPGPMFQRPRTAEGKPVGEGESMWMDPKVSGPDKIKKQPEGTNNHPTVKPIELMKYLIKLVTPKGGHVLDPFNGSGSTGCAAVELGYDYTGIELDPGYVTIAQRRIEAWEQKHKSGTTFEELFE